jgi:hypothetical protein
LRRSLATRRRYVVAPTFGGEESTDDVLRVPAVQGSTAAIFGADSLPGLIADWRRVRPDPQPHPFLLGVRRAYA